ncbi:hypothetical protein EGW08_020588 [Elysia chlorotica]|uniref:Uncharacterized protein n=1 Tax=Elysia chlorotica TaxID=188477 RepID=A0A3S0ZNM7_ELYCH|nr:hypothetical protein EGW08_020588 [Elysia chlorotica]
MEKELKVVDMLLENCIGFLSDGAADMAGNNNSLCDTASSRGTKHRFRRTNTVPRGMLKCIEASSSEFYNSEETTFIQFNCDSDREQKKEKKIKHQQLMACFLKPSSFASTSHVKYIDYRDKTLHKDDVDISIGDSVMSIVESSLEGEDLLTFYSSVKDYYLEACDYIVANFPLDHEVLVKTQVADITKRQEATFSSVRHFCKKFKVLLLQEGNESESEAMDSLESEFSIYITSDLDKSLLGKSIDRQWFELGTETDLFDS